MADLSQLQRPQRRRRWWDPGFRCERQRRIPLAARPAAPVPRGRPTSRAPDLLLGQLDPAPLRSGLSLRQPSALPMVTVHLPLPYLMYFISAERVLVRALRYDARFALRRVHDARRRRPARLQPAPLPPRPHVSGGAEFQPPAGSEFARIQVRSLHLTITPTA